MPPGQWKKSPPDLVERFAGALPAHSGVERHTMFGCPCAFTNGHMFCGLFQDRALVRLGAGAAAELIAAGRAEPFVPVQGRAMKEYVLIPASDSGDSVAVAEWLRRGLEFGLSLAPKAARTSAKKAARRTPRSRAA